MATRKRTTKTTGRKTARSAAARGTPRSATPPRTPPAPTVPRRSVSRSATGARGTAPSPAATGATSGEAERLRALKLQLQAAQDALLLIDPNRLDDVAHAAWSNEIFELARAINALRNVLLEQLSADFAAELPDIEDATKDLADELQELEDAVDVINAVAGVLGVITRIATLVA
jgi:hypothetical protein